MNIGKVYPCVTGFAVVAVLCCPLPSSADEQTNRSLGASSDVSSSVSGDEGYGSQESTAMGSTSGDDRENSISPYGATSVPTDSGTAGTEVSGVILPAPATQVQAPTRATPPASQTAAPVSMKEAAPEPINTRKKFGFGLELQAAVGDPVNLNGGLTLRAWPSNSFALQPSFILGVGIEEEDVSIAVAPGLDFLFSVYKGKATRINFGFGFSFAYGRFVDRESTSSDYDSSEYSESSDYDDDSSSSDDVTSDDSSSFAFSLPVVLQLEHFVTDWMSLYVGARFNLLRVDVNDLGDDPSTRIGMGIDTSALQLGLIFYHF